MDNTEKAFQDKLDQNPDDHFTRMVLADYLDEIGDIRAAGYRELGRLKVYATRIEMDRTRVEEEQGLPIKIQYIFGDDTNKHGIENNPQCHCFINKYWLNLASFDSWVWQYWNTRRQAEDTVAIAFYQWKNPSPI